MSLRDGVRALSLLLLLVGAACAGPSTPSSIPPSGPGEALSRVRVVRGEPPPSSFVAGSPMPDVRVVPFRVSSLPTIVIAGERDAKPERRAVDVQVDPGGDLVSLAPVRREGRLARLMLGSTLAGFGEIEASCGEWAASHLTLHLLDIRADGDALFSRVQGIFDGAACEPVERSRISVQPATLVPGYLFALRVCTAAPCEAGREQVTFLLPPTAQMEIEGMRAADRPDSLAPLVMVSFEASPGKMATLSAIVNEAAVGALFSSPPGFEVDAPMFVGVDIGSTSDEGEPVAVASFGPIRGGSSPAP